MRRAFLLVLTLLATSGSFARAGAPAKPNVLFIAVDDLNDWVNCMGGRKGVHTPNLDRLAGRGVLFTNAHCAAPSCNPSRVAMMTGVAPSSSGIYHNGQDWRNSPRLAKAVTIPEHFRAGGYKAFGGGKIFHALSWITGGYGKQQNEAKIWDSYWPSATDPMPAPQWPKATQAKRAANGYLYSKPIAIGRELKGRPSHFFDWAPDAQPETGTADYKVVSWAAAELAKKHDKPFFQAVGIFRPHIPWYAPAKYFDLYPEKDVFLPRVKDGDLDDVPPAGHRSLRKGWHRWVKENDEWRSAVRGYLASISFADAQVGRLLDALDASPHAKNTIVVLWSDHGMHIGEKQHWEKFTLFEESTRVPLMVIAPGVTRPGLTCNRPVSLLDVYPTLNELCGLPERDDLDGESLVPLLKNPAAKRERPAITTWGRGNHSVRTLRWRYIHHARGSGELYDHQADPDEFTNLVSSQPEKSGPIVDQLKKWLPAANETKPGSPVLKIGSQKQLLVDDYIVEDTENLRFEAGQATKHGVVLKPTLPTDFQAGKVHDGPDGGPGYEFGESTFCWFFSPHWDESRKLFRLWYMASKRPGSALAYAESKDGIHWEKPLVAKDGKSNLVNWDSPIPILREKRSRRLVNIGLDGVTVSIDPRLPWGHAEKYKVALYPNRGGQDCRTRLGYSADGINWSFYNKGLPVTGRAADFSNQIFWDPPNKRYLLICREDFAAGGGVGELRGVRIMEHAKGNDLLQHPSAWKTLTKFVLNDPDKTMIQGTRIPQRQIHTLPIWYYEGVYFALTDVLAATNRPVAVGKQDFHKRHEKGVWEFYMSPSRDALRYDFTAATYPRKALIPRGPDGSFDKDCARPPANIITHKDEHWIYYLATNERWGARKWDARLGLAKLRLDGFFFLEAGESPGTLVTKPFKLEGRQLQVNVDAEKGWVKVELLDESGKKIGGYSANAAKRHRSVNKLRFSPQWKSGGDLSQLTGKTVKLKFSLQNAKLYSFKLAEQAADSSNEK